MPTEACNFRCTYCYEDFAHGRMDPGVVRGLKRYLERRAGELDWLALSWFGGEPLLARDVVEEIMLHARHLVAAHPRLRLVSDLTTNGFHLGPRAFSRLLDVGVSCFQVSLDGLREVHDRTRRRAGGGGTFQRLWTHLLAMRAVERAFEVVVRLHVHGANSTTLPVFLQEFARAFGGDRRFRLLFKEVAPLGGPADAAFPFLSPEARGAVLHDLRERALALGVECVDVDPDGVCYAARGNAFVVRADGRLNKCTVALNHPANDVGRLHEDGRLELVAASMHRWMRGLWSGNAAELSCPQRGLDAAALPVSLRARA